MESEEGGSGIKPSDGEGEAGDGTQVGRDRSGGTAVDGTSVSPGYVGGEVSGEMVCECMGGGGCFKSTLM